MPKSQVDEELLSAANAVVNEAGSFAAAAARTGIDRTTLWRFCQTGRAIRRTQNTLRAGITRYRKDLSATENATRGSGAQSMVGGIDVDDLIAARRFFGSVVELIDAYLTSPNRVGNARQAGVSVESVVKMSGDSK